MGMELGMVWKTIQERLRRLVLEKNWIKRIQGGSRWIWSKETRDRMRGKGLKLCQGRFRLDFREYSSWKGLSSLEFMENREFVASGRRAGSRDKDGRRLVREKMGKGANPNWN